MRARKNFRPEAVDGLETAPGVASRIELDLGRDDGLAGPPARFREGSSALDPVPR